MLDIVLKFVTTHWILTLITLVVARVIYLCFINPLCILLLNKLKYGDKISTFFFPIAGIFIKNFRKFNTEDHLSHKMAIDHIIKNPKSKMLMSNNKADVVYYLHDPELIQEFLVSKKNFYEKETAQFLLLQDVVRQGISGQIGKEWKHLRQITAPAFMFEQIANQIFNISKYGKKMVELIETARSNNQDIDTLHTIQTINGVILVASLMGENFIKKYEDLERITHEQDYLIDTGVAFIASPSILNFVRNIVFSSKAKLESIPSWFFAKEEKVYLEKADIYNKNIQTYIDQRIKETKEGNGEQYKDFLQSHVEEYLKDLESSESGPKMTLQKLRHQFTNMLTAGVGAPSSTLTMGLQMLVENPEWQDILRKEMEENYDFEAKDEDKFTTIQQKMPKLDVFVKETLRMYCPTSGFFSQRKANQDHKLGDFDIKKGQKISVNILGNNNNPASYVKPEKFNPSRWESSENKINQFAYLPFLGGTRNCIGQHYGKLVIKILLLTLLQKYKIESNGTPFQTTQCFNLTVEHGKFIRYVPL